MRIRSIIPMLALTVATLAFTINTAEAANVDVHVNGFLPAPPGVFVQYDAGRPYYVEHERRVYMEKDDKAKHHKHYKKSKHHDNGRKYGHYKEENHEGQGGGRGGGHGGGGHGH